MNILYIDQTGQLGGGELSLFDWLSVAPQDAQVVLFEDGPFRSMLEQLGIPVEVLPLAMLKEVRREAGPLQLVSALGAVMSLRKRLAKKALQSNVLYANSQKAFFLAALAKHKRQALVWHLRDILTGDHFSPILRKLAVLAGNHFADAIIVNSQATADAFIAAGGRPRKIRQVPDGVSARPFDELNAEAVNRLRQEICPPGKTVVGVFGRLAEWKGQHVLLDALVAMPSVHVCVIGDALFGEQQYANSLHQRAAQPDLAGRVTFLGFRKDVPAIMKCMDIVVHTSVVAEPLGRVILEGMLARKPVIATRAGGAAEIVTHGVDGLLVSPGSAAELSKAIAMLSGNRNLSEELAAAGRLRAESAYSLETMAARVRQVLRELSGNSSW